MEGLVLWGGTVYSMSLEDRIRAGRAGGFDETTLFPSDVSEFRDEGISYDEIQYMSDEYDVDVTVLEPYTKWVPDWEPPAGMTPEQIAFYDYDEDEFFEMGRRLGVETINVLEPFDVTYDLDALADRFGRLCDRASEYGWDVLVEFMPFSGIPDLETAWEILERADRDNAGLQFDTWHYYRGTPDHELLRTIPGEKIRRVQVSDADAEIRGSLRRDTRYHRRLPGEGTMDLVTVIRILDEIGGLTSVGSEVFSRELQNEPADEVGRRAGESLRELLAESGVE